MRNRILVNARWLIALLGVSLVLTLTPSPIQAQTPTCTEVVKDYATFAACYGTLADGRPYGIKVPNDWNGTLVISSQGYAPPGTPPPGSPTSDNSTAALAPETDISWILLLIDDPVFRWLLENGYAVATSWHGTGWGVRQALHNQIETLDIFASVFAPPTQTIAYGGSLGGIITAGLVQQHPERFDGALSFLGLLGGSIGSWNQALDFAFVVKQLLGPQTGLKVVRITNPGTPTSGNWGLARQLLTAAQGTPQGRARIALASAVNDVPGWYDARLAEPAADDYAAREYNQFLWTRDVLAGFFFGFGRADIEARAGGNPSWNTGVNYQAQLEKSVNYDEVVALYAAAGLSLEADLALLKAAPRIAAAPAAVAYLRDNIVFNGDLGGVPFLTLHTTGDGLSVVQQEYAYRSAVLRARDPQLLRQAFVHRGGHGPLTWAELIAGFQSLLQRIDTGRWEGSASPDALNAAAAALGPDYNAMQIEGQTIPTPPAFFEYGPAPFLRPYDAFANRPPERDPQLPYNPVSAANESRAAAVPSLTAWPSPYRGGSLQVSLSPGSGAETNGEVAVYDVLGRRIRLLSGSDRGAFTWDGQDANGSAVTSGVYFLRATIAGRSTHLKFVVIR